MTKFVFVTGGVLSSLGKGIAAASLGALLEARFFPQGTYFLKWHPLGNLYVAAATP